jgi:hypothetical protein
MMTGVKKSAVLLAVAILVIARAPLLFTHPRFWAEEGKVYFQFALDHGALATLLAPHNGYYSLLDNVATLLSRAMPLELAPLPTTLIAFLVQLVPFALVLWSRGPFVTLRARSLACAAMLFADPSGEVWVNVINSQFWLCLALFLLFLDEESRLRPHRIALVALTGLTGVVGLMLAPLYFVRAWRERSRAAIAEAAVLAAAGALQFVFVIATHGEGSGGVEERFGLPAPAIGLAILAIKNVVVPLVGTRLAGKAATAAHLAIEGPRWARLVLGLVAGLALAIAVRLSLLHGRRRQAWLSAYLLLAPGCLILSLGPDKTGMLDPMNADRYFFVAGAILLLGLADGAQPLLTPQRTPGVIARALVLSTVLVVGAWHFREPLSKPDCPDWRSEVAAWRTDPGRPLRVWPGGSWRVWIRR